MTSQQALGDETTADEWWDVFISHATEDKTEVAAPLAHKLEERGLRVWLDHQQIDLADNLRGKVNEGIAKSRFAVVLLSARYLDKKWTIDELDAFMAREEPGRRVVLPVLHNIEMAVLAVKYPLLTTRIFAHTSKGLDSVADDVVRVVLKDNSGSPSQRAPSLGRRFLNLVEKALAPAEIRRFLSHHPAIVVAAVGGGEDSTVRWTPVLGEFVPDVCVSTFFPTSGRHAWHVIVLDTLSSWLFESDSEPVPSVRRSVACLESLRGWIGANYQTARKLLPDITPDFQGVILAGRRNHLSAEEKKRLQDYNDMLFGIRIRTYGWLVDGALQL